MNCPRCGSHSIVRNHDAVACLPCGHVLEEPAREPWDAASFPRGGGKHLGPEWTEAEFALWKREPSGRERTA
jgi:hypothetical protein